MPLTGCSFLAFGLFPLALAILAGLSGLAFFTAGLAFFTAGLALWKKVNNLP